MQLVELIPWDAENDSHVERLRVQQIGLGWTAPKMNNWGVSQLIGLMSVFWIVLADHCPDRTELVQRHIAQFPAEKEPIIDTATSIASFPRQATGKSFVPVGRVGLRRLVPSENTQLGSTAVPASTLRIFSLYVSWALQGSGIGSGAMLELERVAAEPPFSAMALSLDTLDAVSQMHPDYLDWKYSRHGHPPPRSSNVDWYGRQGYELVANSERHVTNRATELRDEMPTVGLIRMLKQLP